MKRLNENIGESYYEYLSKLDDLVMLMDESHRYRAKAGMKAITELKPILGLELTATPKAVGARAEDFKNIIYSYDLAEAMADGYVKEPAVATRKDFDPTGSARTKSSASSWKTACSTTITPRFSWNSMPARPSEPKVHPFMLIVAKDTTQARG